MDSGSRSQDSLSAALLCAVIMNANTSWPEAAAANRRSEGSGLTSGLTCEHVTLRQVSLPPALSLISNSVPSVGTNSWIGLINQIHFTLVRMKNWCVWCQKRDKKDNYYYYYSKWNDVSWKNWCDRILTVTVRGSWYRSNCNNSDMILLTFPVKNHHTSKSSSPTLYFLWEKRWRFELGKSCGTNSILRQMLWTSELWKDKLELVDTHPQPDHRQRTMDLRVWWDAKQFH